jgi:hypothetical protein
VGRFVVDGCASVWVTANRDPYFLGRQEKSLLRDALKDFMTEFLANQQFAAGVIE